MRSESYGVAVVIAAWNAEATIGRAVKSSLDQHEVVEVIVVDDASTDNTVQAAETAAAGDSRMKIIRLSSNGGPANARNCGFRASEAPFIAILDADDYFLPKRFEAVFAQLEWDAFADNVVFITEACPQDFVPNTPDPRSAVVRPLSLRSFVLNNISVRGRPRAEMGFMKPVLRKEFLIRNNLEYDIDLRLGEDYAFYARFIALGGRFVTSDHCGYVAVERPRSLSGEHRTEDLAALLKSDEKLLQMECLTPGDLKAITAHRAQLASKVHHRQILDLRRQKGRLLALKVALARPRALPALILATLSDKIKLRQRVQEEARYLF